MTYKEKMEIDHPTIDSNFIQFACPGEYIPGGPEAREGQCLDGRKCADCWYTEIPPVESPEKIMVKKIADRVKTLYCAFRDEDLNDHEAFELTKIIIAEEIRNHDSSVF